MLAAIVCVRSETISTSIRGGRDALSCGSSFLIAATVAMTLAPGERCTASSTARLSLSQPARVLSSGALTARPMSATRIAAPSRGEVRFVARKLRLRLVELRLIDTRVDLREHIALLDELAFLEGDILQ